MVKGLLVKAVGILFVAVSLIAFSSSVFAQQKREILLAPFAQTLKPGDSIDAAIERGRKLFNEIGCAGCHPRGGTIGGTAVDVTGNRYPIPIPDLRGAALHYPRIGMGQMHTILTLGQLNDL